MASITLVLSWQRDQFGSLLPGHPLIHSRQTLLQIHLLKEGPPVLLAASALLVITCRDVRLLCLFIYCLVPHSQLPPRRIHFTDVEDTHVAYYFIPSTRNKSSWHTLSSWLIIIKQLIEPRPSAWIQVPGEQDIYHCYFNFFSFSFGVSH